MPRGDGTGPMGLGSMTGRGAGYCVGYPVSGYSNPYAGRGYIGQGRGRGGGRGFRNWNYAAGVTGWQRPRMGFPAWGGQAYPYGSELTAKQEADMLREQAKAMQDEINTMNEHVKELESREETKE